MIIACTNRFLFDITELSKKVKDGYRSCMDDILEEFNLKSIEDISLLGDTLNKEIIPPDYEYRKIRIKNSTRKEGARGGFRLYCICAIGINTIILLHVYPKTGRLEGEDPGEEGRIDLINEMIKQNGDYYYFNEENKTFYKKEDLVQTVVEADQEFESKCEHKIDNEEDSLFSLN